MTMTDTVNFTVSDDVEILWALIEGIYADPMSFVPEYISNALDAHIEAGVDRPIQVHFPTAEEPWWSVRDFGWSMDHQTVVERYTKIGDSTARDDPNKHGSYGLGSKSGFAYTESFKCISRIDGVERTYETGVGDDRYPFITLLSTAATTEPDGFEVIVPIKWQDFDACRRAGERLWVGLHPNYPECNVDIAKPQIELEGDGWRVTGDAWWWVRMGCRAYPLSSYNIDYDLNFSNHLERGMGMIVDLPMGAIEVTRSREHVRFTDISKATLNAAIVAAMVEMGEKLNNYVNDSKTMRQAMRRKRFANRIASADYRWNGEKILPYFSYPGLRMTRWERKEVNSTGMGIKLDMENGIFLIDRGEKLVRRATRLKAYCEDRNVIILHSPTNKQLASIARVLELKPDQIVPISEIPDIPPPPRIQNRQRATGVYAGNRVRVENPPEEIGLWVPIERGNMKYFPTRHFGEMSDLISLTVMARELGLEELPYLLTPKAQKAYGVSEANRYEQILVELLEENVEDILDNYYDTRIRNLLSYRGADIILEKFNLLRLPEERRSPYMGSLHCMRWLQSFYGDRLPLLEQEAVREAEDVKQKLPMIFNPYSDSAIEAYVSMMKGALGD